MIVLVQANVLTVGLDGREKVLRKLPIQIVTTQSAAEAARSFKNDIFDQVFAFDVIEHVVDDGQFIKELIRVVNGGCEVLFLSFWCKRLR